MRTHTLNSHVKLPILVASPESWDMDVIPQSRATTEMVRAAIMFSLLKYFLTYSAIIAMKLGHYIPEELKMMILCFSAGVIQN